MLAYGHTVADAGPGGQTRESATLPLASLPRHSARVASLPDQTCPHVPFPVATREPASDTFIIIIDFFLKESFLLIGAKGKMRLTFDPFQEVQKA